MVRLPIAKPDEIHLDADRLEQAYRRLERWCSGPDAPIPGGAIAVGRHGKLLEPRFFGRQGPEADDGRIRPDSTFLLASITKPVTCLAAMMLVERGLLNLSDAVVRHIPDFAAHHKEDTRVLQLMTHTSGMPDMLPNNAELRRQHAPLRTFIEGAIHAQPLFAPGTNFSYQSMGTLMIAELVQRLSGMSIRDFLKREIFDPLQLQATALGSRGLDRERLVRVQIPDYQRGSDFGWNSRYWQELGVPWGGMFSSPADLACICQLLLNQGQLGDVRLLSPATVAAMTRNQLQVQPDVPESVRRCRGWGLGWSLNHPGLAGSWGDPLSPATFGHTGATGTMCWMDPDREGFCLLLTSAIRSRAPWRLVQLSNMIAAAFR